jgi:putative RNA 2'-phosphotransferase
MKEKETVRASKFLSLVLRHEPERVGVILDDAGWVDVNLLLSAMANHGVRLSREQLEHIVATSDKKRFAFSEDARRIRANQGHSVEVDLQYARAIPPEFLYHGTATRFLDSIRREGLLRMERHHVHLSADPDMTLQVGARRGRPVLLKIHAGAMHRAGHVFYRSANGVWLADCVPAEFIGICE